MIINARHFQPGTLLEGDVCVIGAGPSGLALCHSLMTSSLRIVLLERGDEQPRRLDRTGDRSSYRYRGLTVGRYTGFGGTAQVWTGQCMRLSPFEMTQRPWVPLSGWPLTSAELEPYYAAIERQLGIAGFENLPLPSHPVMSTHVGGWEIAWAALLDNANLGDHYRRRFASSPSVTTVVNGCVTGLEVSNDRVDEVRFLAAGRNQYRVKAKVFVLAAGAIENARLLMSSPALTRRLPIQRNVGHYLQDHGSASVANLQDVPGALREIFMPQRQGTYRVWPHMCLGPQKQEAMGVLNASVSVISRPRESHWVAAASRLRYPNADQKPAERLRDYAILTRRAWEVMKALRERRARGVTPVDPHGSLHVQAVIEQEPQRANRVVQLRELGSDGLPNVEIKWGFGRIELETLKCVAMEWASVFRSTSAGMVSISDWLDRSDWEDHVHDTFHHLGTTRMSESPTDGVVDRDCKVFGVPNLFVAGGSIFPTSGIANPTLTMMALATRLGSHLASELRHGRTTDDVSVRP